MKKNQSFSSLMRTLRTENRRGFLVLSGNQIWCHARAAEILSSLKADQRSYWISQHAPRQVLSVEHIQPNKIKALLGNDAEHLVLDAWEGFSPDTLAVASGALCGGGLLILLVPDLAAWEFFEDPDYERFTALRPTPYRMSGYFIARSCRFFASLPLAYKDHWPSEGLLLVSENEYPQGFDFPAFDGVMTNKHGTAKGSFLPTDDQQKVIKGIDALSRLPSAALFVEADRGRGKSVALGLSIQSLLKSTEFSIAVVAPLASNVANLFAMIAVNEFDRSRLNYFAVDELLSRDPKKPFGTPHLDILLIDEAAAIPLPVLSDLSQLAPRVVFATTLIGYEGSGRGFTLRFKDRLRHQFEQIFDFRLNHAIRWSDYDPLEQLLNKFLVLDAATQKSTAVNSTGDGRYDTRKVTAKQLLCDERLLRGVFSLLMQAHYQTRPSDLRQLLDAPYLKLWITEYKHGHFSEVVGVLLCCDEGGFNEDDKRVHLITSGQRRPRGNLLSQLLSQRSGQTMWCQYRSLRVMRIAIEEPHRRSGLASDLISTMETYLTDNHYHYWGTSFGYHKDLLSFWNRFNIYVVNLGLHRDKASGLHSMQLIKPVLSLLVEPSKQAFRHFVADLMEYKKSYLTDLCRLDIALLVGSCAHNYQPQNYANRQHDTEQLNRFLLDQITFDQVYPALKRIRSASNNTSLHTDENDFYLTDTAVLTSFTVDNAPQWRMIAEHFCLSGRREVIQAIKTELILQTRSK